MKKKFQILLIMVAVGSAWVVAGAAALEHMSYHYDIQTCRSDNLHVIKDRLNEFVKLHNGSLPESSEELRQFVKERKGYDYYECHVTRKPFVWKPKSIRTRDGRPVIAMCPLGSHGFLRKFSWGLIQDGDQFCFVKVLPTGEVVPDSFMNGECRQVPG